MARSEAVVRREFVSAALESYRRLDEVINKLTEEELREALALEADTCRRVAVTRRLIRRIVRLVELKTKKELTERYEP